MEELNRMSELADKWLNDTISEAEMLEFEAWYNADINSDATWTKDASEENLRLRLLTLLKERIEGRQSPAIRIASRRRIPVRWAAAASVIGLMGVGAYFLFFNKTEKPGEIVKASVPHDISAPAENHATITLAGGQKIVLDSVGSGTLATQDNMNIIKKSDGQIAYAPSADYSSDNQKLLYNTLTNPKGSKVANMTLADGSRVWLNAGSSIKYPVAFAGNERTVEVTGEAYLSVVRNPKQPFKVKAKDVEIEDLGTAFNVAAYEDESVIKTTLIEGSVKVKGGGEVILKPGEQAVTHNSGMQVVSPDLEQVVAWRNGLFNFNKVPLAEAMRNLARWYDVDVVYEHGIPDVTFGGEMERNMSLASALKFLNRTSAHFRLEGRTIIVTN